MSFQADTSWLLSAPAGFCGGCSVANQCARASDHKIILARSQEHLCLHAVPAVCLACLKRLPRHQELPGSVATCHSYRKLLRFHS